MTTRRLSLDEAIRVALDHHQQGRLREAETIYREILKTQPNHFDALHLLGLVARQTGHPDAAIDLTTRAISINPHVAAVWSDLAFAHLAVARPADAIPAADKALALDAKLAAAYLARGAA